MGTPPLSAKMVAKKRTNLGKQWACEVMPRVLSSTMWTEKDTAVKDAHLHERKDRSSPKDWHTGNPPKRLFPCCLKHSS